MRSEVKFASRDDLQSALQADRERPVLLTGTSPHGSSSGLNVSTELC